jgi:Xaa-Pro aminopeptidase
MPNQRSSVEASAIPARLERVRLAMRKAKVPAMLLSNPLDVTYLSGFPGEDSYLLVTGKKAIVLSDSRFSEECKALAAQGHVQTQLRSGAMMDEIVKVVTGLKVSGLYLQAEHATIKFIETLAGKLAGISVRAIADLVVPQRMVKTPGEVKMIRKAIAIQQEAMEGALKESADMLHASGKAKGGAKPKPFTEQDFAAILEYRMRRLGSPKTSFETIVGSGPNAALPHYRAAGGKIKPGTPVLIDWGATFGGYHGDMTRVVNFGSKWPAKWVEIFKICEEAHHVGAAALAPGKTGAEVDAAARDVITKAGYGPQFGHSLGHGIGLQIHEGPGLSKMSTSAVLAEGMVVTIEPGIYLPGLGGVRLEDDYLITAKGAVNLCSLKMDLTWATRG